MRLARRNFLSLLGVGAASAPAAAKAAIAEIEATSLSSLGVDYNSPLAGGNGVGGLIPPSGSGAQQGGVHPSIRMSDYIRLIGKLPDHVDRNVREQSKYVAFLDPDIANKRSWSLSVKILTQQQRNYQRSLQNIEHRGIYERAQEAMVKLVGWRWDY